MKLALKKTPTKVRVRTAPSPTGFLHIGNARAALFNYLFARQKNGVFVLRIEDTDRARYEEKFEKDIAESLSWLNIMPDESPEKGGLFGPYRQSERTSIYRGYLQQILADGKAFYCFHTVAELMQERKGLLSAKRTPLHVCAYRNRPPSETENLKKTKKEFVIRFKTSQDRAVTFHDLIRGEVSFQTDLMGDFSIAKDLDQPLYNFAAAVDDHLMEISHVLRGEEHITNTPKQILILETLGYSLPHYVHLPIILAPDRSKLSKRHGATAIGEYRAQGYLPEALVNFMSLLGWNPGGNRELLSREELIREFSLERVQKSGAVFDKTKLDWMNAEYIRKMSPEELLTHAQTFFPPIKKPKSYLSKILALEQPRLKKLSLLAEATDFFFKEPEYSGELLKWKGMTNEELTKSLNASLTLIEQREKTPTKELEEILLKAAEGWKDRGKLLWPLRVALSGKKASPGPFEIMEVLGPEESKKRLKLALNKIQSKLEHSKEK